MKILGNTPEGDLIIQVTQEEWRLLQEGVKPESNSYKSGLKALKEWERTETHLFLSKLRERPFKLADTYLSYSFRKGEFDGTLKELRRKLEEGEKIDGIGATTEMHLLEAIQSLTG